MTAIIMNNKTASSPQPQHTISGCEKACPSLRQSCEDGRAQDSRRALRRDQVGRGRFEFRVVGRVYGFGFGLFRVVGRGQAGQGVEDGNTVLQGVIHVSVQHVEEIFHQPKHPLEREWQYFRKTGCVSVVCVRFPQLEFRIQMARV